MPCMILPSLAVMDVERGLLVGREDRVPHDVGPSVDKGFALCVIEAFAVFILDVPPPPFFSTILDCLLCLDATVANPPFA